MPVTEWEFEMRQTFVCAALAICGSGLFACGTEAESTFAEPAPSAINSSPDGAPGLSLGEMGPRGTASECVSEVASASLAPTNLIFIYDRSGSMGDAATGFDPEKKWIPVGTGMKEFFADPYSKSLRASLQFFPMNDDTIATTCAYPYETPAVTLTNASDSALPQAIDATNPSGGTPTLPALEGAIAYAKKVAAERPGEKTAVVLVSDGEPGFWDEGQSAFVPGCQDNDVAHAASAAKAAFDTSPVVPTYVVGIGPKLDALNAIAEGGGTSRAIMVNVDEPAKTKLDIVESLAAIRRSELTCDFAIPPAPAGKELDPYAINVVVKGADQTETVLGYSKDCELKGGWRYDDSGNPKRISLCADSCATARSELAQVKIAFGCKTRVAVP